VIKTNILSAHSKSDITGKSVAKFCAKYLHVQILKLEGKFGLATAAKKAYFRYLLWRLFLLWYAFFFLVKLTYLVVQWYVLLIQNGRDDARAQRVERAA
jgi:hypothetical protein